jgi:hypothetical protein
MGNFVLSLGSTTTPEIKVKIIEVITSHSRSPTGPSKPQISRHIGMGSGHPVKKTISIRENENHKSFLAKKDEAVDIL